MKASVLSMSTLSAAPAAVLKPSPKAMAMAIAQSPAAPDCAFQAAATARALHHWWPDFCTQPPEGDGVGLRRRVGDGDGEGDGVHGLHTPPDVEQALVLSAWLHGADQLEW